MRKKWLFECNFVYFLRKIYFKKSINKIKPQSPKDKSSIYLWSISFAPDCSATVKQSKCVLTPNENSMYIRFLCVAQIGLVLFASHQPR